MTKVQYIHVQKCYQGTHYYDNTENKVIMNKHSCQSFNYLL